MATNPYSNVSVSGYNASPPTDDGAQTEANRLTWAKHKTKIGDPLKTAIEAMDSAVDDAFATIAAILVDFTGDFGSGGITGLVPAPAAGDAANNRFLRADGTWTTPAGAGSVTSVATGSGLTGGPITGSGTISLASIANNTVLGNLSGVTAAPGAVLLPALLNALDVFQGDLGSGGVKGLVPAPAAGESNLFLRGDGTWAATVDNYSGTVTSIATGSGLTGGTITTSGTISLASISNQTLLANLSGSAAAPSETNISELTPYLSNFGGDFGSGGSKGLVPAPAAGDSAKYLRGDGTWVTVSGTGTVTSVNITAPAAGITATGGPVTVSGSITLALADDLAALEAMSSTGIVTRTASNTYAQRTITGTSNQITVTNGDGVSGNPTISLPSSITISGSITVGNTGIVVGASTPFSDSTGTLTLQNVDALDATTEATIEAAIDTLANLTSIQGRTVTLADAGANAIFGWDDTAGAYENLTAAEATATLNVMVGDSGAGGTKGLVPAPAAGDSTKALFGNGTWQTIPGGGDALTSGNLSQFASTTSLQLKGVMSDETGSGALVFADTPTLVTPILGTPTSGTLTNCTGLPVGGIAAIANRTFVGNVSGSSAVPTAVTAAQLLNVLDTFIGDAGSGGVAGIVPAPAAGDDGKFLNGNGTWSFPTLGTKQVYTTTGANLWTKPVGLRGVKVTVVGGGGAGGGADATTGTQIAGGSGGGGGGAAIKWIDASSLGTTEVVTVGAGGTAVSGGGGNSGGTSSFGAHCTGPGGNGGAANTAGTTTTGSAGAAGGLGTGGDLNIRGCSGTFNLRSGSIAWGGVGGASILGGGGTSIVVASGGVGGTGGAYGGGGGGAANGNSQSARAGGAGGDGIVIVEEFY